MFDCFRYWDLSREYDRLVRAYHEAAAASPHENPFVISREISRYEAKVEGVLKELETLGKCPDWCTEDHSSAAPPP